LAGEALLHATGSNFRLLRVEGYRHQRALMFGARRNIPPIPASHAASMRALRVPCGMNKDQFRFVQHHRPLSRQWPASQQIAATIRSGEAAKSRIKIY
jgi:hypothetical protein